MQWDTVWPLSIWLIFQKLGKEVSGHQHFQTTVEGFVIHHYAGIVSYNVEGFCDHNRDVLFPDLIVMMQSSGR